MKGSIPKADETNENTRHVADRGANQSAVHEAHREVNPSKTGGGIVHASETEGAESAGPSGAPRCEGGCGISEVGEVIRESAKSDMRAVQVLTLQ